MIAALFVATDGVYFNLPGIDPWDEKRDARLYNGPHPVVAHPPCERWGVFWSGGPLAHKIGQPRKLGDDNGCFRAAINAVRTYGGVIEHPRGSKAWDVYGIKRPKKWMGWTVADEYGGFTCSVDQGSYGHRSRKTTWLYVCGIAQGDLPELKWVATGHFPWMGSDGYRSKEERDWAREEGFIGNGRYFSRKERAATPVEFRDVLIDLARRVKK